MCPGPVRLLKTVGLLETLEYNQVVVAVKNFAEKLRIEAGGAFKKFSRFALAHCTASILYEKFVTN